MNRVPGIIVSILLAQLCVLIVAGAAVAAYLYADGRQEIFGGRAEILYEGQQVSLATEAERQVATQRALLESASTLGPVAERFGLVPDALDEDVSVESVGDSNVLRVTVSNADPAVAVDVAQAVAETYIAQVVRAESPELEEAKRPDSKPDRRTHGRAGDLRESLGGGRQQLAATRSTVKDGQVLAEMESLLGRVGSLQDRLTELEIQQTTAAGARILTPAYLLDEPLEPNRSAPGLEARSQASSSPASPCSSSGAFASLHERSARGVSARWLDRGWRERNRRRKLAHRRCLDDHQPDQWARPGCCDRGRAGPTYLGNTYQATNLVPNLVFELLTGSLLAGLIVPPILRHLAGGDVERAKRVAGGFLGVTACVFAAAGVILAVGAPLLLDVITVGVDDPATAAAQEDAGWLLLALFAPQVALYGVAGVGAAVQNSRGRFALAAGAPAIENVVIVATLVVYAFVFGTDSSLESVGSGELLLLGLGTSLAVALHAGAQWLGAAHAGIVLVPRAGWRDPEVREIARRGVSALGYSGLNAVRIFAAVVVANRVAGGVVAFGLALNLYYLPVAIGARPFATALLPRLARLFHAAALGRFRAELAEGVTLVLFVTVPAAVFLATLSGPWATHFSSERIKLWGRRLWPPRSSASPQESSARPASSFRPRRTRPTTHGGHSAPWPCAPRSRSPA